MDYLVYENGNTVHYSHKKNFGIVKRTKHGISWSEYETVLGSGLSGFGLYPDSKSVHIITQTTAGELMYVVCTKNDRRKFILQKLPDDCRIIKIFVYPVNNRLNMLYSLKCGGELLLMHCILSEYARPNTVAKLRDGDFFTAAKRVYYTIPDGSAGFSELSDEKPAYYIRIAQSCSVPYLYQGHIAFKSNGKIYFDNRELCKDSNADGIIITEYNSRLFVVWQSGGYVRYLPADSNSNRPHAVIKPPLPVNMYGIWHNDECYYFYGSHSDKELITYVNPSPLDSMPEKSPEEFLSRRMENMKYEIAELKKQLSEYI